MVKAEAGVVLAGSPDKTRYKPVAYFNPLAMKMAAGAATLVVSRAGSSLFEIASWGVPSILIPITNSNLDHQRKNAFNYAHAGACSVIEEINMNAGILSSEIERITNNKTILETMGRQAKAYHKPDAALKIARELVGMALSHEK